MNKAMWRYYAINSIICHGELPTLFGEVTAEEVFDGVTDEDVTQALKALPAFPLDELETMYLNYFRTPCAIASTSAGTVVPLSLVAEQVRSDEGDSKETVVSNTTVWAEATCTGITFGNVDEPTIKDSVVVLPTSYQDKHLEYQEAMHTAYAYYCWGVTRPTSSQKDFVRECFTLLGNKGPVTLAEGSVAQFIEKCTKTRVNPITLGKTCLHVHDLQKTIPTCRVPVWWANFEHTAVSMMLQKGVRSSGNVLVNVVLPIQNFRTAVKTGMLDNLYVSGNSIMEGVK